MRRFTKNLAVFAAVLCMTILFSGAVLADDGRTVRDFPGFNGSGTRLYEPTEGLFFRKRHEKTEGVSGWAFYS